MRKSRRPLCDPVRRRVDERVWPDSCGAPAASIVRSLGGFTLLDNSRRARRPSPPTETRRPSRTQPLDPAASRGATQLRLERVAELRKRSSQEPRDAALRRTEPLRDLALRQVAREPQAHDRTLTRVERLEQIVHERPLLA